MPLTDIALPTPSRKSSPISCSMAGAFSYTSRPPAAAFGASPIVSPERPSSFLSAPTPPSRSPTRGRKRDEAKRALADGEDPSVLRQKAKIEAAATAENTFGLIAAEYLDRLQAKGCAPATLTKNRWFLEKLAGPALGHRPISQITPVEVLSVLQSVERSGRLETARSLRSTIGSVFRLAISTLRAENRSHSLPARPPSPAQSGSSRGAHRPEGRRALLCSIDTYTGWPSLRAALLFNALTFCRPGEVRGARWKEIDFDKAVWTIPEHRM